MARINIEDSLFKDTRFAKLIMKMGCRTRAIGAVVEAWILAQQFVTPENPTGLIPESVWVEQEINPAVLEVKLARHIDGKIQVAGAKENFAWLVQKHEAGRKGGRPKKEETERLSPINENNLSLTGSNPPSLTPSLTLATSSISKSSSTVLDKSNPLAVVKNDFEVSPETEEELIAAIPQATKDRWSRLYGDRDFIYRETLKAFNWYANNPRKRPKKIRGWISALSSWFDRGWKSYVREIESNKAVGYSSRQMAEIIKESK